MRIDHFQINTHYRFLNKLLIRRKLQSFLRFSRSISRGFVNKNEWCKWRKRGAHIVVNNSLLRCIFHFKFMDSSFHSIDLHNSFQRKRMSLSLSFSSNRIFLNYMKNDKKNLQNLWYKFSMWKLYIILIHQCIMIMTSLS